MNHQRRFKRAPFFENILLLNNNKIYQAKGFNISENGIFISNISDKLSTAQFNLMFPLIDYPEFILMDREQLFLIDKNYFQSETFRCEALLKRKRHSNDDSKPDDFEIGLELSKTNENLLNYIRRYVKVFEQNIEFILTLFQDEQQQSKELIFTLLELLGYTKEANLSSCRSKILHDYNSLIKT